MAFAQKLADGLTLRSVRDEADKEHFAAFSAFHNGPAEGAACACLLHHHPDVNPDDFWLVESDATREIVSTTCLIPWNLSFAGQDWRAAQLEMVLTHPAYRGRGLVRTQIQHFEQVVKERSFDLSIIWGIPYYYRQYGYAYAIDGATVEALPVWRVPDRPLGEPLPVRLRTAGLADIPCLTELFERANDSLDIAARRSPEYWRYLLEPARHTVEIVERAETGEALGYVDIQRAEQSISILENSLPDAMTALAYLQTLKVQASQQIQISWPGSTPLAALAHELGGLTVPGGQWLLRIPNVARFLIKLRPVFEQRLANSAWRHLSAAITLNLFRQAFRMRFDEGKVAGVDAVGFVDASMGADGGHLCIPPEAFVRLLFGYRALDELLDAWPDTLVKPEARSLLNTLFPRLQPFLNLPFHSYA